MPEYQRVRDYVIRTEPLPRTTTRKLKRFEAQQQLSAAGRPAPATRALSRFTLSATDRALLDAPAGALVAAAIRQQQPDAELLHPQMNLELDLGLDSLARTECVVSLKQTGLEIAPEELATTLTVGELIRLVAAKRQSESQTGQAASLTPPAATAWQSIPNVNPATLPELQGVLRRKPLCEPFAWLINRLARVCCRLEVKGLAVARRNSHARTQATGRTVVGARVSGKAQQSGCFYFMPINSISKTSVELGGIVPIGLAP